MRQLGWLVLSTVVVGGLGAQPAVEWREFRVNYASPSVLAAMFGQASIDVFADVPHEPTALGSCRWRAPRLRAAREVSLGSTVRPAFGPSLGGLSAVGADVGSPVVKALPRFDGLIAALGAGPATPGLAGGPPQILSTGDLGLPWEGVSTGWRQRPPVLPIEQTVLSRSRGEALERAAGPPPGPPAAPPLFPLPAGIQTLHGYDLLSSLVVSGQPTALDALREQLHGFDLPPQQVELAVRYMFLPRADAGLCDSTWSSVDGTLGPHGDRVVFRLLAEPAPEWLYARSKGGQARSIGARNEVLAAGEPLVLRATLDLPVSAAGNAVRRPAELLRAGTEVLTAQLATTVVIRVQGSPPKEKLTMSVQPCLAGVGGPVGAQLGALPRQAAPGSTLTAVVNNGDTLVLAALRRQGRTAQPSTLLAQLPFVGGLFGATGAEPEGTELVIALTPTIVREPGINYDVAVAAPARPAAARLPAARPARVARHAVLW